jgi:hypothetical protein
MSVVATRVGPRAKRVEFYALRRAAHKGRRFGGRRYCPQGLLKPDVMRWRVQSAPSRTTSRRASVPRVSLAMHSSQGPTACQGQRSSDRHAQQQKWESEASSEGEGWNRRGEPQREASPATLP